MSDRDIPSVPVTTLAGLTSLSDCKCRFTDSNLSIFSHNFSIQTVLSELPISDSLPTATSLNKSLLFHPRIAEEANNLLAVRDDSLVKQLLSAIEQTNSDHIQIKDQYVDNFTRPIAADAPQLLQAIHMYKPHVFNSRPVNRVGHPTAASSSSSMSSQQQQQQQQYYQQQQPQQQVPQQQQQFMQQQQQYQQPQQQQPQQGYIQQQQQQFLQQNQHFGNQYVNYSGVDQVTLNSIKIEQQQYNVESLAQPSTSGMQQQQQYANQYLNEDPQVVAQRQAQLVAQQQQEAQRQAQLAAAQQEQQRQAQMVAAQQEQQRQAQMVAQQEQQRLQKLQEQQHLQNLQQQQQLLNSRVVQQQQNQSPGHGQKIESPHNNMSPQQQQLQHPQHLQAPVQQVQQVIQQSPTIQHNNNNNSQSQSVIQRNVQQTPPSGKSYPQHPPLHQPHLSAGSSHQNRQVMQQQAMNRVPQPQANKPLTPAKPQTLAQQINEHQKQQYLLTQQIQVQFKVNQQQNKVGHTNNAQVGQINPKTNQIYSNAVHKAPEEGGDQKAAPTNSGFMQQQQQQPSELAQTSCL
jgi:hypothetical protein